MFSFKNHSIHRLLIFSWGIDDFQNPFVFPFPMLKTQEIRSLPKKQVSFCSCYFYFHIILHKCLVHNIVFLYFSPKILICHIKHWHFYFWGEITQGWRSKMKGEKLYISDVHIPCLYWPIVIKIWWKFYLPLFSESHHEI